MAYEIRMPLQPTEEAILINWIILGLNKPGKSNTGLARALGIEQPRIVEIKKGDRQVKATELPKIARYLEEPIPAAITASELQETVRVPFLSWVTAGHLVDVTSRTPEEAIRMLAFADLGTGDFFALKVSGDSMDRVSPDGSIIVVNRAERDLLPGKAYVFSIRGETTFKLWEPRPARLEPYSTNPTNRPIFIDKRRALHIIGRVKRTTLDL